MRLAGRITDWKDDKGFGFVVPNGGGDRAFVHVNEFQRGSRRPVEGDLISYLPSPDSRGRLQAKQIRHSGQKPAPQPTASNLPRAALGMASLATAAVLAVAGLIPYWLLGGIGAMSLLAYFMYWADKSAARQGRRRTPESTLHFLALVGGWPGALVAQQQFRHKTVKASFQAVFWVTVALSLAGLAWLLHSGLAFGLAGAG